MGITRTPMPFERDFVQIPNAWLRDERLSRRARGLLAELMTHRPGWHVTIAGLQKAGPEGRDAIRSAVTELAEHGYLIRRQTQGAGGRFNEIEYEISDPTAVGKSDTGGFADDGSADVGESAPKNTSHVEHHRAEEELSPSARELEHEFDRAYAAWPKKTERKKSLQAFIRAAKKRDAPELVADVIRFGQAYAASTEKQFTPALCVWLNGERWEDELPTQPFPTQEQWDALLAGEPTPGARATRTEQNMAVVARIEAQERALGGCSSAGHRWMSDGTCNFCTARRDLIEAGAA